MKLRSTLAVRIVVVLAAVLLLPSTASAFTVAFPSTVEGVPAEVQMSGGAANGSWGVSFHVDPAAPCAASWLDEVANYEATKGLIGGMYPAGQSIGGRPSPTGLYWFTTAGTYRVCSYTQENSDVAWTRHEQVLTVTPSRRTINVSVPFKEAILARPWGPPLDASVTVSGAADAEHTVRVEWLIGTDTTCNNAAGSEIRFDEFTVKGGEFSKTFPVKRPFVPAGSYANKGEDLLGYGRVCAVLEPGGTMTGKSSVTARYDVEVLPPNAPKWLRDGLVPTSQSMCKVPMYKTGWKVATATKQLRARGCWIRRLIPWNPAERLEDYDGTGVKFKLAKGAVVYRESGVVGRSYVSADGLNMYYGATRKCVVPKLVGLDLESARTTAYGRQCSIAGLKWSKGKQKPYTVTAVHDWSSGKLKPTKVGARLNPGGQLQLTVRRG